MLADSSATTAVVRQKKAVRSDRSQMWMQLNLRGTRRLVEFPGGIVVTMEMPLLSILCVVHDTRLGCYLLINQEQKANQRLFFFFPSHRCVQFGCRRQNSFTAFNLRPNGLTIQLKSIYLYVCTFIIMPSSFPCLCLALACVCLATSEDNFSSSTCHVSHTFCAAPVSC